MDITKLLVALLLILTMKPTLPLPVKIAPPARDGVVIDETNFPDDGFRAYLKEYCDRNGDGALNQSELEAVTEIDVTGMGIYDLTGVERFTELETLICTDNRLHELDVSQNTELEYLFCAENWLTTLDVSRNPALQKLICYDCSLTELNVSNNPALTVLNCRDNQLTAVNIGACPYLIDAYANGVLEEEYGHMRYETEYTSHLLYVDSAAVINIGPVIIGQPESRSASEGHSVEFSVEAAGGDLTYQWYYRTSETGSWSKCSGEGAATATMTVEAKAYRDGYQYKCRVSSDAGHTDTDVVTLTVTG